MSLKNHIVWRVGVVYIGIFVLSLGIIGKLFFLIYVEGSKWEEKAEEHNMKYITIDPNRGDILADDGRLLASSVPYYEIRMDLMSTAMSDEIFMKEVDSLAFSLSKLFNDKSKAAYKLEIIRARGNGERYHLLKKGVNYIELKKLKTFPLFRRGRYKGGFIYIQKNKRILPHIELAARTIGYLTKERSGNVVGIEGAYDHELSGIVGVRLMQRLSGNVWMPVNTNNEVEPRDGNEVVTTIDINLQDVAENALLKQLSRHNAHHGTAILMEVQTGEIKAIANLERDNEGRYHESYNYGIGESTEPGSTFKLPALIAALEDKVVSLDDTIDTGNGKIRYYDKTIKDSKKGGYGKITVRQVFELSSNVGMSKIINENYKGRENQFINRLYAMGLNEKLNVEIKGEGSPYIQYPGDKYWSGVSLPMISHGYEVRMTPLQILTFYNAVANNGKMVKPGFVREIRYHGERIRKFDTKVINPSICSDETIRKVHEILEGVVENGTAKNLRNDNFKIAGKTGTAQIANEKYGYKQGSEVSYQASFVGYFPADNPKYSCIVVINSPTSSIYYGNLVAGPVFKEIADKVYATSLFRDEQHYFNISETYDPPYTKNGNLDDLKLIFERFKIATINENVVSEWVATVKQDSTVLLKPLDMRKGIMPNVKEMGLRDALYILENMALKVEVKGYGKVIRQSVVPGTKISPGLKVLLEMSMG
ncbi:MAG: transpeptidase family protein [Bacteroidales bacterium]|nr:transpeptidase family protein [Bacteroidales bacterium]